MILLLLVTFLFSSEAARILVLSPIGTKSHNMFFMGFVEPLAKKGHQITYVSPFGVSRPGLENFREIILPYKGASNAMATSAFKNSRSGHIFRFLQNVPDTCANSLQTKEVQQLKKENFDLIILSNFFDFCFLSIVHALKVPFVYASAAEFYSPARSYSGSFDIPSLIGITFINLSGFPYSTMDRLMAITANGALHIIGDYFSMARMEEECRKRGLCPDNMPPLRDFHANASLSIVNSVKLLEEPPRPEMPHVIYAGGCHIKEPKRLPKDLEDWIMGSGEHGFIFFSLGSAVKPSEMDKSQLEILINVFRTLNQRVLWKWDEEGIEDLPSNVRLGKWLPQNDILAHPKLRLFITHGGLLSTQESTYHGVPVIGMPVFADQYGNIGKAVRDGFAYVMHWNELTEISFSNVINKAINDKSLKENSLRKSKLMRDVPRAPTEEVVYWIEYVLRHNGAHHLRSPLHHMPFYVLYNFDVYAILLAIVFLLISLPFFLLRCIYRRCTRKISTKKRKKH